MNIIPCSIKTLKGLYDIRGDYRYPFSCMCSPTNDINTTVALALLTSVTYFYVDLSKKGLSYLEKYIKPTPILLPTNILKDFTKPLSLSFRLFRNILADLWLKG
ncbi:hypothetical protein ZWY2020_019634 [Hordeum vulgare]|nr:hypothetical protein ZWY2020_019634 [Hordeum vulgare]